LSQYLTVAKRKKMNPKDLFLLSFEALVDRKVRTLLTILMVVLGSSLVVVLNGLSAGQSAFLEKQFNTLAANVLFVGSGNGKKKGPGVVRKKKRQGARR